MRKFVVVTAIGVFFGLVTGVLYGISMQDFLGAIGMFFGMIAFFYVAAFGVWMTLTLMEWAENG